jgi:hypothetical protein
VLLRGTFYHLDALRFRLKIKYVAREDRFLSILFLIFESEGRASNKSKAKYGRPRSAELEPERYWPRTRHSPEYIGREVWVRWDSRCVRIFNERMEQVAMHTRIEAGKFSRSLGAGGLTAPVLSSCRLLDPQKWRPDLSARSHSPRIDYMQDDVLENGSFE